MTRNFLKQEREGLYKPLPPGDTDLLLTPHEIEIIENSEPPTKKRRTKKGSGRTKRKKKKSKSTRKKYPQNKKE
tara:strand:- start:1224 stop:1445 length:222 start_codon:yes stop_codon:yes gene_type:complete